ncbi:SDR family oxidoreductase [uncultured Jannaschia sp.]|uniref:SDR family oxidoreductase n=1 Tax=uncultured Jannaschia sp. TaxID=293347 RepID=UPI00260B53AF|nr:SDR family oxidoreductase [uncultured Jannaschia sp.]
MTIQLKPLAEQRIVITGASSGIGLATARMAASRGARVLLAARDETALHEICRRIERDGGTAEYLATDVGSEDAVQQLAGRALERFGGFDTWVNVAGIGLVGPLRDIQTEDHRRVFDTNYWGVVYGSLAAAHHFRERKTAGAIINLGSAASDIQVPFAAPYAATKFAIKGFTDSLRIELMQEKLPVGVTLIKPSTIDTGFFEHARTTSGAPLKAPPPRYSPDVVARAILYAAEHPKRSIPVGSAAAFGGTLAWLFPGLTERALSMVGPEAVADREHPREGPDALRGVPDEGQERSGWYAARTFSVTTAAQTHPVGTLALALVLSGLTVATIPSVRRRLGWSKS